MHEHKRKNLPSSGVKHILSDNEEQECHISQHTDETSSGFANDDNKNAIAKYFKTISKSDDETILKEVMENLANALYEEGQCGETSNTTFLQVGLSYQ